MIALQTAVRARFAPFPPSCSKYAVLCIWSILDGAANHREIFLHLGIFYALLRGGAIGPNLGREINEMQNAERLT